MDNQETNQESLYTETGSLSLGRRDFLKLSGTGLGGLYIFFKTGALGLSAALPERRSLPEDFNAFLHVDENGSVTCLTGKIEMGQGVITSLAQMLADELAVAFEKVSMVMGDTDLCPYDAGTWGSLSVRVFGPAMLAAAAEARAVLLAMAAEKLGVNVSLLSVKDGVISVKGREGIQVTYGELAKGQRIERFMDKKPEPMDYSAYTLMGKPIHRTDSRIKVTGEARYAGDFRMPGMVYAKVLRPPSHGATLVSADTSEARKVAGAAVIEESQIIAVLHEDPEIAENALRKIRATYSFNEKKVENKNIHDYLLKSKAEARLIHSSGDLAGGKTTARELYESTFYDNYIAHSAIETHSALAYREGEKLTAIVSTQSPFGVQDMIARELELPLNNIRVITPFVGGAFGGKAPARQALEAARLAKLSGKPVMVHWTREEEFFYDTFRPAAVVKISSGTDRQGNITLWDYHEYYAGSRGADTVYDVPNQQTTSHAGRDVHPFATGAWRAPGNSTNTFARESQVDIMAARLGMDPLEFRLKNLKDEKMTGVLKAVADLFGWTPAKSPSGKGYGIACGIDAGSYVAHMAEVKVDEKTGRIQVVRVACAQDMGFCVNPHGSRMQMEGCIIMGLGYALTEEVDFEGGMVRTSNYGTYKIPLFTRVPKIDTHILDKKEPMQGGGEPAIICMGGVIANAVFDACGARLYQMPMTPERVLEALGRR